MWLLLVVTVRNDLFEAVDFKSGPTHIAWTARPAMLLARTVAAPGLVERCANAVPQRHDLMLHQVAHGHHDLHALSIANCERQQVVELGNELRFVVRIGTSFLEVVSEDDSVEPVGLRVGGSHTEQQQVPRRHPLVSELSTFLTARDLAVSLQQRGIAWLIHRKREHGTGYAQRFCRSLHRHHLRALSPTTVAEVNELGLDPDHLLDVCSSDHTVQASAAHDQSLGTSAHVVQGLTADLKVIAEVETHDRIRIDHARSHVVGKVVARACKEDADFGYDKPDRAVVCCHQQMILLLAMCRQDRIAALEFLHAFYEVQSGPVRIGTVTAVGVQDFRDRRAVDAGGHLASAQRLIVGDGAIMHDGPVPRAVGLLIVLGLVSDVLGCRFSSQVADEGGGRHIALEELSRCPVLRFFALGAFIDNDVVTVVRQEPATVATSLVTVLNDMVQQTIGLRPCCRCGQAPHQGANDCAHSSLHVDDLVNLKLENVSVRHAGGNRSLEVQIVDEIVFAVHRLQIDRSCPVTGRARDMRMGAVLKCFQGQSVIWVHAIVSDHVLEAACNRIDPRMHLAGLGAAHHIDASPNVWHGAVRVFNRFERAVCLDLDIVARIGKHIQQSGDVLAEGLPTRDDHESSGLVFAHLVQQSLGRCVRAIGGVVGVAPWALKIAAGQADEDRRGATERAFALDGIEHAVNGQLAVCASDALFDWLLIHQNLRGRWQRGISAPLQVSRWAVAQGATV
ncbi:hypothetical protein [Pseudomonas phage pPA-3099-2aT.3]|nr:hypothetical protein [Pseudomonas phage pPA-3099-2aT.3]